MAKTLAEVTEDAAELSGSDQLKLARILLEICEGEAEPSVEVEDAWDAEIERRLAELRTGNVKGVPLEEVKKKMKSRFGL